jgi:hypothetical protein
MDVVEIGKSPLGPSAPVPISWNFEQPAVEHHLKMI